MPFLGIQVLKCPTHLFYDPLSSRSPTEFFRFFCSFFFFFLLRYLLPCGLCVCFTGIWAIRDPNSRPKRRNKRKKNLLRRPKGLTEHVCKGSGSTSGKRREQLVFLRGNKTCEFCAVAWTILSSISIFGVNSDLMLDLRSQIFEYLRGMFLQTYIEVPEIGSFRKKM